LDKEGGGYFNTPGEDPSVLLRVKEDYDGAEPSGNSMAAINMIRLSSIFDAAKSEGYKHNVEHLLVCIYLVYSNMHYNTALVWFQNRFTLHSSIRIMHSDLCSLKCVILTYRNGKCFFVMAKAFISSCYMWARTMIRKSHLM
jgi:uncharacterized protein YyaL (SSP411 family)